MRRRLMTAFIGLVAAVLVIAGAGSIVLTNNAARTQATQQLASEAQSLTVGTSHTQRLAVLKVAPAGCCAWKTPGSSGSVSTGRWCRPSHRV